MDLTFSIADQNFHRTKSLGILNLSLSLLRNLSRRPELDGGITVLSNSSLQDNVQVPATVSVRLHDLPLRGMAGRILWDQWGVYGAARATGRRWLLLPKGYASFTRRCPVRLAAIVSDAMNDHYRRHHPGAVSWRELAYFKYSLAATFRTARVIFTISDFSRSELLRLAAESGLRSPPIHTIGVGFSDEDPILRGGEDRASGRLRDGVTALVSRWPHKLTPMVVAQLAAWRAAARYTGPIHLVGALPDGLPVPEGMSFLPRPSNEEYAELLRSSQAVVFASEYEGFGMPPVEAMLCGAAPVFSELPVTREVMEGTGFPFLNHQPDSFLQAMNHAMAAAPAQLRTWAAALRARHTWDRAGDVTLRGLMEAEAADPA